MIRFTQGNLLEADVEAVVNTVNEVGVMGKGIALMFKEAFPENFISYAKACKAGEVRVGEMFVTRQDQLLGPKWIVNFPTKKHWRNNSKFVWITDGLKNLREFIIKENVTSIAIPPLGSGNGGLAWEEVRKSIMSEFDDLDNVEILVYEPTSKYQNVTKREGVSRLTPARALIAELVRRYALLGFECSMLEIQKLAWFLERNVARLNLEDPLDLQFEAGKYGPYANRLTHLLNALDGSYLECDRRIPDASLLDTVRFNRSQKENVAAYLSSQDAKEYVTVLENVTDLIDGYESPHGLELLATIGWLLEHEKIDATIDGVRAGLASWPGGIESGARKSRIFDDREIGLALKRLTKYQ